MREFDWLIHYRCNYRCSYCFFNGMWDEVEQRPAGGTADEWLEAWHRVHVAYGDIKVIITGGEPFLFPGYVKLVTALTSFAALAFDTNLSCRTDDLRALVAGARPSNLFIGASFHPERADLREFMEKVELLQRAGIDFRVHYITYPPHLAALRRYKEIFTLSGMRFTPIPFRGRFEGKMYPASFTAQEKELIYGITEEIAPKDKEWANRQVEQVQSRGCECRAGQMYARVDSDGTAYPCASDYMGSRGELKLGNLLDGTFRFNEAPMRCRQERCPCEFRWIAQ